MNLTRFDPFDELIPLRNKVDRLFNLYTEKEEEPMLATKWAPVADILETKDHYIVRAEIPGMEEKDITVEIENGVLTLKGERKFEAKTEEKDFRRIERSYGQFLRSFTLPTNVNTEKITAAYVNGVIEVMIPKKEEAKPKKVTLEVKKKLASAA
ncbi:MAG TPA: Hsp20/alpha crystallin family protein [Thermoanaerobaculia bacterium]|nr:Hsp20/alpha crystallin family protein [Thermoanaerobaculia bacterium]